MTESQLTQPTDGGNSDIRPERVTFIDSLPERLADDEYVRYLARRADDGQRDSDRLTEVLNYGAQVEAERNTLRGEVKGLRASMNVASWIVMILGALYVIAYIVSVVTV